MVGFYGASVLRQRIALTLCLVAPFATLTCSNRSKQAVDPPSHTDGISATETPRNQGTSSAASLSTQVSPRVLPSSNLPTSGDSADVASQREIRGEVETTEVAPVPALQDASGLPLPQTEDIPTLESPSFKRRIELLYQAIQNDAPQLARPAFFPLVAYEQVKAISQPERDWNQRLVAAFARDIHEYHRQLGADAAGSKLLGVEAGALPPRWMKPGTEGNKLGYYRVLRSWLRVELPSGQERKFEVTSMISWRGEWYVVHLHGFK